MEIREIMNLSAEEMALLPKLVEMAREAIEDAEIIRKHFQNGFGMDKKEVHVYQVEGFGEYEGNGYLSIDGVFRYHDNWWGGRTYQFKCDAEGIYRMLRSCYLREIERKDIDPCRFDCQIENLAGYFREFISEIKKKNS